MQLWAAEQAVELAEKILNREQAELNVGRSKRGEHRGGCAAA